MEGSNSYVTPFEYNPREDLVPAEEDTHPLQRDEIAEFERMHQLRSSKQ